MNQTKSNTKQCRSFRARLSGMGRGLFNLDSWWLQRHISTCKRCQARLGMFEQVDFAMSLLKTQPQRLDLLQRANHAAISTLGRTLREDPQTEPLKTAMPQPSRFAKLTAWTQPVVNIAACLFIAVMLKTGVYSQIGNFKEHGDDIMQDYYTSRLDADIADDLFG